MLGTINWKTKIRAIVTGAASKDLYRRRRKQYLVVNRCQSVQMLLVPECRRVKAGCFTSTVNFSPAVYSSTAQPQWNRLKKTQKFFIPPDDDDDIELAPQTLPRPYTSEHI